MSEQCYKCRYWEWRGYTMTGNEWGVCYHTRLKQTNSDQRCKEFEEVSDE